MAKKPNLSPDTNPNRTTATAKPAAKRNRNKTTVAETASAVAGNEVPMSVAKPAAEASAPAKRSAAHRRAKPVQEAVQPEAAIHAPSASPVAVQELPEPTVIETAEDTQYVPQFTITHDDIATLAFSYWERRGYQAGSPDEDWRRAEEELQSLLR